MLGPGPQLGVSWTLGGKKKGISSQGLLKEAQEELALDWRPRFQLSVGFLEL